MDEKRMEDLEASNAAQRAEREAASNPHLIAMQRTIDPRGAFALDGDERPRRCPPYSAKEREVARYGVVCREHGKVGLTDEEYSYQMGLADAGWVCPECGERAGWDDDREEAALEGALVYYSELIRGLDARATLLINATGNLVRIDGKHGPVAAEGEYMESALQDAILAYARAVDAGTIGDPLLAKAPPEELDAPPDDDDAPIPAERAVFPGMAKEALERLKGG